MSQEENQMSIEYYKEKLLKEFKSSLLWDRGSVNVRAEEMMNLTHTLRNGLTRILDLKSIWDDSNYDNSQYVEFREFDYDLRDLIKVKDGNYDDYYNSCYGKPTVISNILENIKISYKCNTGYLYEQFYKELIQVIKMFSIKFCIRIELDGSFSLIYEKNLIEEFESNLDILKPYHSIYHFRIENKYPCNYSEYNSSYNNDILVRSFNLSDFINKCKLFLYGFVQGKITGVDKIYAKELEHENKERKEKEKEKVILSHIKPIFICPICDKQDSSKQIIFLHIKSKHNLDQMNIKLDDEELEDYNDMVRISQNE